MTDTLGDTLDRLWRVIDSRRGADPAGSYTAKLLSRGKAKVAQKFGEEAVEAVIEGVRGDRAALVGESADVLYHLLVMWAASGIGPEDVAANWRGVRESPAFPKEGAQGVGTLEPAEREGADMTDLGLSGLSRRSRSGSRRRGSKRWLRSCARMSSAS